MASLIALVCEAHPDRGVEGPFITLVDGLWAYCAAGYLDAEQHRWRPIEPVGVEILRMRGVNAAHRLETHSSSAD